MRSHRRNWLGSSLLAAGLMLLSALSATVRAQPGYGADPFWPYNRQYTPYVAPIGPASPEGGGRAAMVPRAGIRGANEFESYLEDLQGGGPGRGTTDRAGIGVPYYRSAVTPLADPRGRDRRQYQPNANERNANYERSQRNLADRYYAYYSERDPARRAELLKEYRQARREASLAVSGRGGSPSRVLDSSRLESGLRRSNRPPAGDRPRGETGRYGPAPDVPAVGTRRSSSPPARRTSPSDILDRSRAMDRDSGYLPGSPSSTRSRVRGPGRSAPAASRPAPNPNP